MNWMVDMPWFEGIDIMRATPSKKTGESTTSSSKVVSIPHRTCYVSPGIYMVFVACFQFIFVFNMTGCRLARPAACGILVVDSPVRL